MIRPTVWLLALPLATVMVSARADFRAAMDAYQSGNFESARTQFQQLAELGDTASQMNLGVMALKGQGGVKDLPMAVGWLRASIDNGSGFDREHAEELRDKLSGEDLKAADELTRRFNRAGLAESVLPIPFLTAHCRDLEPPRKVSSATGGGYYPWSGRVGGQNGFVIVEVTVGVDGVPRDPEVLMSIPSEAFSTAGVEVVMHARYEPARRAGVPVEAKTSTKVIFKIMGPHQSGVLWDYPGLQEIRQKALTGDPTAQYQIGLAAMLDLSLGISPPAAQRLLVSAAQGGNPRAQYWSGERFLQVAECVPGAKKLPWLRAAAANGEGGAQLALALDLLAGEPSESQLGEAKALLEQAAQSSDFYVQKHVAALLAAAAWPALRDPAAAKLVADRLIKVSLEADPQLLEAAAAAYAASGNFWMAVHKQQAALESAQRLDWHHQRLMQERLAAYRKSQAWTGDVFALPQD